MAKAVARYANALTEQHPAWSYLTQTRGLTAQTIDHFGLGVVDDPLAGHEQYAGRLAIPYLAPDGDVLSVRFRRLGEDGPKYATVAGDIPRIFNAAVLEKNTSRIAVCEGEIDTMTAVQAGIPAIGVPGVSSWRPEWAMPLEQYDVVYVLADNDDTGQGREMGNLIAAQLDNVRVVLCPRGHDVNSLYLTHGKDAVWRLVDIRE
ncbi:toprim domain-containing protein [Acrocarpospora sp. B8E8]|uniref:toprim domain-containing protein n=1 Tax=Acrocarpospora sp. B8E8 TaxID=3153572 RepID=UPI00325F85BA